MVYTLIWLVLNLIGFILLTLYSYILWDKLEKNNNWAYVFIIDWWTAEEPERKWTDFLIDIKINLWGVCFNVLWTVLQIVWLFI